MSAKEYLVSWTNDDDSYEEHIVWCEDDDPIQALFNRGVIPPEDADVEALQELDE